MVEEVYSAHRQHRLIHRRISIKDHPYTTRTNSLHLLPSNRNDTTHRIPTKIRVAEVTIEDSRTLSRINATSDLQGKLRQPYPASEIHFQAIYQADLHPKDPLGML